MNIENVLRWPAQVSTICNNPYPDNILSIKCCLIMMSIAYNQYELLDNLNMELNAISTDKTTHKDKTTILSLFIVIKSFIAVRLNLYVPITFVI